MTLHRVGRMHHLGVGCAHAGQRVLATTDDTTVTVIDLVDARYQQQASWGNTMHLE